MEHSFGTAQGSDKATPGKICQFKLMLLGESNVGKSCLAERFPVVQRETGEVSVRTLGWDLISRNIALDGTAVKLVIWDTTGQKRFRCVISMYYRGAQAAIVVYDITNQASFERAKAWVRELQEQASSEIVIALAGNKCDLTDRRVVKFEDAQSYAEENGLLFMETSVRTAMNVNNIFLAIARKLLNSQSGPGQGTWLNKCCK